MSAFGTIPVESKHCIVASSASMDLLGCFLVNSSKSQHLYIAPCRVDSKALSSVKQGPSRGVAMPFPLKLHELLNTTESDGFANVMSWQPHGRAFVIHETKEFVETAMPQYFCQPIVLLALGFHCMANKI